MRSFSVRKIAVLGSGVMGAQIAAHCTNAGIPVILFDLAAKEGPPNGVVNRALDGLKKLDPDPLATRDRLQYITAANYDEHLPLLAECGLVIEAIAEKVEWKHALYEKVAPHLHPEALLASNTSGLSINTLAQGLSPAVRRRFCGVHFFNPPRHMSLVELIPCTETLPVLLDALEGFLTTALGKNVLRARDTPNFIANRIGVFAMLAAMHHTQRLGLGFDEVDALTGPLIGRAKSATYRTLDVVGLDVVAHAIRTLADQLPDDPWHRHFQTPDWLQTLIGQGALGQKTRAGIFRKQGKTIQVRDLAKGDYRDAQGEAAPDIIALLKQKDPAQRLAHLCASRHPQAQFLWAIFRDVFHYAACQLESIAFSARDIDLAMRWGFGWQQGPFELWQCAGWRAVAEAVQEDIATGNALSMAPLPEWVFTRDHVHGPEGAFSPATLGPLPRSAHPVYQRQLFPETLAGEPVPTGTTLWETEAVRLWLPDADTRVPVLSFKSKMNAIGLDVLEGIQQGIARAERDHDGLILWQTRPPFSAGANLAQVRGALDAEDFATLEGVVARFQATSQAIRYAQVPVIAAVSGMALGGGCEFVMHAARAVVGLESYIGLVEAGVGLIPAGGGCKEFAIRAARDAARTATLDPMNFLQAVFQTVAMAKVSTSGHHARELGLLKAEDTVIAHPAELLYVARQQALALHASGWRAPLPALNIPVAGRNGIATLEMMLVNMREGGLISAHDYTVARAAAVALCGGEVEAGTLVSEDWLLAVERAQFMALLKTPATRQRIVHMLETGKPLRN